MTTGTLTSTTLADTADLLAVMRALASSIDFTASVAASTSASGAVAIDQVTGLSLVAAIDAASSDLASLIATPATLATALIGLVQNFSGAGIDFRHLADLLGNVSWTQSWRWNGLYADQTAINRDALQTLLVNQAVIEAVRASSTATFASQDDAFALGNDLVARLDVAVQSNSSRAGRSALLALKTALIADINTRAAQLDALESWVNAGDIPALVLASRIYDDPTRAGDIAARNAVGNPLFVPAGTLTILTPDASV